MPQCIYRPEITLNHDDPANDSTASLEHFIPWAAGGSGGFSTRQVSKKANNDLGSSVDAPFSNLLPIAIKRHQFRIKSQGGNIEPIIWEATAENGAAATVTIDADFNVEFRIRPDVQKNLAGQVISVAGAKDQVVPILKGLLGGWRKRNETAYDKNGKVLKSLEDCLTVSDIELLDKFRCRVQFFNPEIWGREIMKIVLGLGHDLLGPSWTFGPNGNLIRQFLHNAQANWPTDQPRGFIAGEWGRGFRVALGKTAKVRDTYQHTVAILPYNEEGDVIALVSLFGGNGVPESAVTIGRVPELFDRISGVNASDVKLGYRIDPITRATTPITFGEIDKNNKRNGPTSRRSTAYVLGRLPR